MSDKKVPHVHSALIKAWADGATIQWWSKVLEKWEPCATPVWDKKHTYRVKPEPKPDFVRYGVARLDDEDIAMVHYLGQFNSNLGNNIKLVFDGETRELKDARVLGVGES